MTESPVLVECPWPVGQYPGSFRHQDRAPSVATPWLPLALRQARNGRGRRHSAGTCTWDLGFAQQRLTRADACISAAVPETADPGTAGRRPNARVTAWNLSGKRAQSRLIAMRDWAVVLGPRHPSTAAHLVVAQRPPELGQVSHPLPAAVTSVTTLPGPEAGNADIRDRVLGGPFRL